LLDGDDNVLKEPTGDDSDDGGATSVDHIAPNLIGSNMMGQAHPSAADRVDATAPSASGQKRKRPPSALKRKQSKTPVDQVMTQIKLSPYCEPRSSLDLVDIEIIFGHFFEAFRHASQAASDRTLAGGATQPVKKTREPPLKSILTPR
jgi:hypothetical protein